MSDLLPCRFCEEVPDYGVRHTAPGKPSFSFIEHDCRGPFLSIRDDAAAEWNAANAPADPALLALAKLGAWIVRSHANEPGDVWATDIEDAEDQFGVVVPTTAPAGRCAAGGLRDDSCRCTEFFHDEDDFTCRLLAPGIAAAIAALLVPDGADSARGVDDAA